MNTRNRITARVPGNSGVTDPGYRMSATRPFYWSVRRELVGEPLDLYRAADRRRGPGLWLCDQHDWSGGAQARGVVARPGERSERASSAPYDMAAMMMIFTVFIVGVFYCLDALHGERRDRSILFWKSLPVSDLTTVLSKVTIPLVILPLISFRDHRLRAADHAADTPA